LVGWAVGSGRRGKDSGEGRRERRRERAVMIEGWRRGVIRSKWEGVGRRFRGWGGGGSRGSEVEG
jgi:hypothetical protein